MPTLGTNNFSAEELFPETGVTIKNLRAAQERICTNMEQAMNHFEAIKKARNAGACEVCGSSTYWRCAVCKKYMRLFDKRNSTGGKCAFFFHSEKYFGFSRSDYLDVVGKGRNENGGRKNYEELNRELANWKPASDTAIERHARCIARLIAQDERQDAATSGSSIS